MSFSIHGTNGANDMYVMGDGFTQGIHDTTLYVEKKYYRNFTEPDVKFNIIMVMIVICLLTVDKN